MDRRIFPERSPGSAGPRQPDLDLDPEEFSRLCLHRQRPGNGRDGIHPSRGSRESCGDTGTPGEPRSRRHAGAQREKVENTPGGIRPLGKDFRDEPAVPRQARNGKAPRERMEQPRAGSSEDEEGEPSWDGDAAAATAAGPELGAPAGNGGIRVGMVRASGNAESGEEDEGSEDSGWDRDWYWEPESEREAAAVAVCTLQSPEPGALQEEFPEVWARSGLDCGLLAQEERLDGDPVPFQPQPRLPAEEERRMAELLREYLREGIVEEGTSRSNNPLVLRRKPKGGGWRLGLDCRALNAATPAGPRERPDRAGILASVHPRSRFFSVLDLCSACLAVPLASASRPRFAFTFRGRQFVFARLPPGFRDTNSILHRRVAAVLARLEPEPGAAPGAAPGVFHYYDDILITGKGRRQAESRTRRVLELIRSAGFKVNRDKAQLVRRRVNYLGVTLGAEGRGLPEEKVREICAECDAPGPWDPRRLRSVLKKLESRQEFIPDFWELALPLQREGERGRGWRRDQRERLRRLRERLEAAPVLCFPLRSRPFLVRLRVHEETAGAALLQEKAGTLLPVGYHSHRLSGRDLSRWDAWRQAALRAVRAFQTLTGSAPIVIQDPNGNYLLRGQEFITEGSVTDGSRLPEPWTLLAAIRGPEPRESRRVAIPPAPPLGQLPPDVPRANVWFLGMEKGLFPCTSVGFGAANLEGRRMDGVSGRGVVEDAALEALREILEQHRSRFPLFLYCNCPGLAALLETRARGRDPRGNTWPRVLRWLRAFPGVLRVREVGSVGTAEGAEPLERERLEKLIEGARVLACITRSSWIIWEPSRPERQEIVAWCHQSRHEGVERSLKRVWEVEHWGSSRQDVTRWVRSCPTCRESDPHPDPDPAPQRAEGPWSRLRIGLCGALPSSPEGFGALLVVQDELSGWLDAFPLRRLAPADVSRTLLREVFGRLGKVGSVLPAPAPAWLRRSLEEIPLRSFWSRLERAEEPPAAAAALARAARAAGEGWAGMLPLILAAVRSQWIDTERLLPLLCVPGLPLELCWEWPGREPPCGNQPCPGNHPCPGNDPSFGNDPPFGNDLCPGSDPSCRNDPSFGNDLCPGSDPSCGNELSRLRGMRLLPGYRERVEAALRMDLDSRPGIEICQARDWGTPDPGSEYARGRVRVRWIRDWILPGHELRGAGSGIAACWTQAPP
uniref:ribonuclease H n=1 Tax=Cyanoderma ruficeps TaxID=181631 RepID=A0A8C3QJN0_9PASS